MNYTSFPLQVWWWSRFKRKRPKGRQLPPLYPPSASCPPQLSSDLRVCPASADLIVQSSRPSISSRRVSRQSWTYRSILPPQLTYHLASALVCALLCVPPVLGLPFNPPAPVFQSTGLQLTSDQMSDFVSQLPNDERQSLMRKICRLCDPLEAAEATFNLRLYKKHAGVVYVQYKMNQDELDRVAFMPADQEADYIDLKIGETSDIERRRDDYTRVCVGENIGWAFYYETQHVQLLERLTHLTLKALGAKRQPYPCSGCGVRHREHFAEMAAAGLEGVAAVIEYWMRRLGENPQRIPMYN
ncbi:hypothetical protein B0H11DRAFT_2250340 [Mycena galericulata]|nr:hypothetical protein B0H11DRAFT_2250340 [Mycena galericulata]